MAKIYRAKPVIMHGDQRKAKSVKGKSTLFICLDSIYINFYQPFEAVFNIFS